MTPVLSDLAKALHSPMLDRLAVRAVFVSPSFQFAEETVRFRPLPEPCSYEIVPQPFGWPADLAEPITFTAKELEMIREYFHRRPVGL